jgi:diguanylate cyclase (GGDEF)-like protein
VADAAEGGTQMALMILDLDRFKEINDTLGHHAGDLVLEALAQRLQTAVRSSDTVARLGGDEFAILLPQVADETAAVEMAARVQASLVESIDAGGIALDVDASIGIAISGQNGDDVATLLQHADIAMYRAKALDLGVCVYREAQNDNSREHLELLGELRRALDNNELVLHFQPKLRLKDSTLRGAEALVRWEHPTRGLLGPALFLAAAERTAMIGPLTRYVINAALAECQRWSEAGKHLRLAVNVSARNLLDVRFVDDVTELFGEWGLPRSCLMFEVTESAIMVEPKQAKATLTRFADLGIDIAIDDFGAGYTSLAHLRTLPVRELKIDQSLVAQMRFSAKDALIVRAVIDLARNLGLRTVAEGVEDETTLASVTLMGCDIAQGFHIAPPMTGAELSEWCAARETKALLLRT